MAVVTGRELRDARKLLRLTLNEMGEALGMSGTWIGIMERGGADVEKRTELAVRYLLLVQRVANYRKPV